MTYDNWKLHNGEGKHDPVTCKDCEGKGWLYCEDCNGEGCKECDNDGNYTCPRCDGDGAYERS